MKTVSVILSISAAMATLVSVITTDAASAQTRRARTHDVAKAAAVTSTPEQTEARQDAHQENQESRQERRDEASSTQKAVTYNVAKVRQQEKATKQAAAASALSERKSR